LQHQITQFRSVPLDVLFRRLVRPVRDVARQEGKAVALQVEGADIMVDRAIAEALYAPFLHIVRNAVSHGIETPAIRQAMEKPPTGTIRIIASQCRTSVAVSIQDDGKGLDYDALLAQGRALGVIAPDERWDRERLTSLITLPGFTTSRALTTVSGRGVGMDVVARAISALNGSLALESKDHEGTTVTITLPTTSAIDEVLLVQAGTQLFALSLGFVTQVLTIDVSEVVPQATPSLRVRDETLPVCSLAPLVGEAAPIDKAAAVVLRAGNRAMALLVDRVHGKQEGAIRPLGPVLDTHTLLSGAIMSATGTVILVLRVGSLLDLLAATAPRSHNGSAEPPPPTPLSRRVLFVDDSVSVRKVAAHFLQAGGLDFDTAVDGIEALEKLATGRFTTVVTDLEMPRMHGYELIAQIRRDPRHSRMPVIVCSSRSLGKHRDHALALGANGYLTKPFTHEELLAEIRRVTAPGAVRATSTSASLLA
jgi:chemosensory pili system protein ChpA (sensor histidine kinase/response regulator)